LTAGFPHFSVGFLGFGTLHNPTAGRAFPRPLAALFAVFAIAFVAMSYELIEWCYAAYGGNAQAGANFLGSQGDIWDAQKDMFMDTLGAIAAVLLFFLVRRRPAGDTVGLAAEPRLPAAGTQP
jgi:putative membrane protein